MKEVLVTCLVNRHLIGDLNLPLVRGQEMYLTQDRAQSSTDLELARRSRAVSVQTIERSREVRVHPTALRTPPIPRVPPPKHMPRKDRFRVPLMDNVKVKEIVDASIKQHLAQFRLDLVQDIKRMLAGVQAQAPVAGDIKGKVSPVVVEQAVEQAVWEEEPEPIFIPSNIVANKEAVGLSLEAESHEGLDDALVALRRMKAKTKER